MLAVNLYGYLHKWHPSSKAVMDRHCRINRLSYVMRADASPHDRSCTIILIIKQWHACPRSNQLKLMEHTNSLSETLSLTLLCVFANNAHRDAIRVIPCNYYTNLINGLTAVMDVVKTVHGAEFGFALLYNMGVISRETMWWL